MKTQLPSPTPPNKGKTSPLPGKGGLEKVIRLVSITLLVFLFTGCATWYQRTADFQAAVNTGNFEKANKLLDKDKKQATGKNRILYYLNKGYVEFMLGNPVNSNQYFETAENLIDEYHSNIGTEAAVLITNPEARPYRPEDFEVIMINFYKALNYIDLNDMEGALVEVRKINIKLNQLNDKYPDNKNRYQRDAFAHLLMGLIYDATGDYNNAFIAYRNAYEVYQSDYIKNFGVKAPEQLKQDLMRTAYNCGFTAELKQYEQEFNTTYTHTPIPENGQLVFFWLNGMGPVKAEWSINFVKQKRGDGAIVFHNESLGLSFPFFFGSGYSEDEKQVSPIYRRYVSPSPNTWNVPRITPRELSLQVLIHTHWNLQKTSTRLLSKLCVTVWYGNFQTPFSELPPKKVWNIPPGNKMSGLALLSALPTALPKKPTPVIGRHYLTLFLTPACHYPPEPTTSPSV